MRIFVSTEQIPPAQSTSSHVCETNPKLPYKWLCNYDLTITRRGPCMCLMSIFLSPLYHFLKIIHFASVWIRKWYKIHTTR